MCPMANRIAGFGLHACIWIPSETLEPVCHHIFIWHLIGEKDSYLGNELSFPIMCQMKERLGLPQTKRASVSGESCPGWENAGRSDKSINQSIGVFAQEAKVDQARIASATEKRTL